LSLGLLAAGAAGQDWTCAECEEGGAAVGALASSEEAINGQAGLLVAGVCPQAPDPAYCAASLPGFWASLGPIIMVEHFKHICDDMEQCKPPPPPLGPQLPGLHRQGQRGDRRPRLGGDDHRLGGRAHHGGRVL